VLATVPAFAVIYFSYLMPTDSGFYLRGLKSVYANWKPGYYLYLNGVFSQSGWWYYFLEAFLIKTPIPALIAFAASILLYKKIKIDGWSKALVFLPMLFFAFVTNIKAQNISIRYLIPVFPFLILYTGGLAELIENAKIPEKASGPRGFTGKIKNDNAKFKNSSRLGGIPKFYILIFTFLILSGWYVFSSIRIYPDYMAYFNEFVGGSKNGYK
jgi:hypothetical protein